MRSNACRGLFRWSECRGVWPSAPTQGFTYIEILITLAIIAVLFIPMMRLFSYGLYSVTISGDLITATNLARLEMEKIRNLNWTKKQFKSFGDQWNPKLEDPPLEINQGKWRVWTHFDPNSDPLEVTIRVYSAADTQKPVASLVTLIEDNIWKEETTEVK